MAAVYIGVEAGQFCFVLALPPVLWCGRRASLITPAWLWRVIAYAFRSRRNPSHRQVDTSMNAGDSRWLGVGVQLPKMGMHLRYP